MGGCMGGCMGGWMNGWVVVDEWVGGGGWVYIIYNEDRR